ncbi:60Kd inner membrane protein-domain-containing protein [Thelephora terrestris]|uniref:60Kd inner membrane protein-domain-containing protein n=1 Tax=Thelephora terrestris TaxID=56493 RepID=A0A9P6H807_9AGAM|nr:60Kd inner membrane protein-domain-containing protein [Thelephora terrestris]
MLSIGLRRSSPFTRHATRHGALRLRQRRTFFTSTIQALSDQFLDLAVAIPYPASLPAYSTTIILVTVASRLILTVPFSVWAKKVQWKTEDEVLPQMQSITPQIAREVRKKMSSEGATGTKEELNVIYSKLLSLTRPQAQVERKKLLAKHGVSPALIVAVPVLTQLPVFVLCSLVFSRLTQPPSVLDSETFLTLTSLVNPDPTAVIPILIGMITFANVESAKWFITDQQKSRQARVERWNEEKRAQGDTVIEPKKIVQNALRVMSVGRILIAAMVPGAVEIYWLASASFGLVQTWAFDWISHQREKNRRPPPPLSPSGKPLRMI